MPLLVRELLTIILLVVLVFSCRPDARVACLTATATTARKAGEHHHAAAALGAITHLLQQQKHTGQQLELQQQQQGAGGGVSAGWVAAAAAADAPWVMESIKLMWARVRGGMPKKEKN